MLPEMFERTRHLVEIETSVVATAAVAFAVIALAVAAAAKALVTRGIDTASASPRALAIALAVTTAPRTLVGCDVGVRVRIGCSVSVTRQSISAFAGRIVVAIDCA